MEVELRGEGVAGRGAEAAGAVPPGARGVAAGPGTAATRGGTPRVAIVGAGIAGLAAAYFLRKQAALAGTPLEVVVFEAAGRAGGHIVSEDLDGFLIEGGPDCFVSQKPWGLRLAQELGLAGAVTSTASAGTTTYVLSDGRLHPLPEGTMLMVPTRFLPLAGSGLLTWPGKLRMGLDLLLPRGGVGDESLGAFVRRRLGQEALEKIAEPLVAGVHAGDPDRLSLLSTFPRFKEMEQRDRSLILAMVKARRRVAAARRAEAAGGAPPPSAFVTLAGGLETFARSLGAGLPDGTIRLGTQVVEVARPADSAAGIAALSADPARIRGFLVRTAAGSAAQVAGSGHRGSAGAAGEDLFDAVVLALPAKDAARLTAGLEPTLARELAGIDSVSAVTVSLAWRREAVAHPLDGFGLVIPRREKRPIMGVTWTSSKFPGRAPDGTVLLRAFLGGVKGPEILAREDAEILALVRAELRELLGAVGEPLLGRLYRWPEAMPQYNVGHGERLKRLETMQDGLSGLVLAGGSYRGIGIPDCIQSGVEAAGKVLARLGISAAAAT